MYPTADQCSGGVCDLPPELAHLVSPFPDPSDRSAPGYGAPSRLPFMGPRGMGDAASAYIGVSTAAGGAVGSIAGPAGTAVGANIGGTIASLIAGLFGGGAAKVDTATATAIATKWYTLYLGRAPDASGLAWWIKQIQQDGAAKAWGNFSNSSEPLADQAAQKAAALTAEYGGPLVPIPGTVAGTTSTPPTVYNPPIPGAPQYPATTAPLTASVLPTSITPTTLLLAAALLGGAVLLSRRRSSAPAA